MDVSKFTPDLGNYWRCIVAETKFVENTFIRAVGSSSFEHQSKILNFYEENMGEILRNISNINTPLSKQFLLQILDEPLPLLWSVVLDTIAKSDEQIYVDAIREFSETPYLLIDPLTFRGPMGPWILIFIFLSWLLLAIDFARNLFL